MTDANLVLGRIAADRFLGGEMRLDKKAAEAAILKHVGNPLGISAKEADRRHPTNPDDPFHTFFFALSSGRVIDGTKGKFVVL